MKQIYQPETDNQEFWNRVNNLPVDTEQSLKEFWQLIHEPGAEYDSGILEYIQRECRFMGITTEEFWNRPRDNNATV